MAGSWPEWVEPHEKETGRRPACYLGVRVWRGGGGRTCCPEATLRVWQGCQLLVLLRVLVNSSSDRQGAGGGERRGMLRLCAQQSGKRRGDAGRGTRRSRAEAAASRKRGRALEYGVEQCKERRPARRHIGVSEVRSNCDARTEGRGGDAGWSGEATSSRGSDAMRWHCMGLVRPSPSCIP